IVVQAERHCLEINIKTQSDSLPKASELSFKVPDGDILFVVRGRTNGVDTYEPGPFERNSLQDMRDFRWLLDFEGRELHNHPLQLRADAIKRSVNVYNGLFYTHGSQGVILSRPPSASHLAAGTIEGASNVPQSQNILIARSIGCDIYLDGQEEFQLRYRPGAGYSITLRTQPTINYEISVTNLCAFEAERELAGSSDFALYYDIINVPENQQFKILPAYIYPDNRISLPSVSANPYANDLPPCNPAGLLTSKAPL